MYSNILFELFGDDEYGYGVKVAWTEFGERKSVETGNIGLCRSMAEIIVKELSEGEVPPDAVKEVMADFLCSRVYS